MFDLFLRRVKRSIAQLSTQDAARILLALVADHPSRKEIAARFMDWEELMHDSEMSIFPNLQGTSISRKEGDELLKSFVRSVISEVWKP